MNQNREVWAIPGSIFNPQVKGCHALIRQGAKLVEETAHILEDIASRLGQAKSGHFGGVSPIIINENNEVSADAQQVLQVLGWQVQHFDALQQGSWDAASLAHKDDGKLQPFGLMNRHDFNQVFITF